VLLNPSFGELAPTELLLTVGNSSRFDDFISVGSGSDLTVTAGFVTLSQEFSVTGY